MNRSSANLLRQTLACGLVVAAGLALSGCGRRGALEAPGADPQTQPQTQAAPLVGSSSVSTSADGTLVESAVPVRRELIKKPDRPFILDKIL